MGLQAIQKTGGGSPPFRIVTQTAQLQGWYIGYIGNVTPGLITLKRLFHWEGTIKKYQVISDEMTIGGVTS